MRFLGNEEHRSAGFVLQRAGNSIVAGTVGDGVWISHNGGADWQILVLQGKNIANLDRTADGTLFACAKTFTFGNGSKLDGGFYRLQAGQTDWEAFQSSPQEIVTDSSGNLFGIFRAPESFAAPTEVALGVTFQEVCQSMGRHRPTTRARAGFGPWPKVTAFLLWCLPEAVSIGVENPIRRGFEFRMRELSRNLKGLPRGGVSSPENGSTLELRRTT